MSTEPSRPVSGSDDPSTNENPTDLDPAVEPGAAVELDALTASAASEAPGVAAADSPDVPAEPVPADVSGAGDTSGATEVQHVPESSDAAEDDGPGPGAVVAGVLAAGAVAAGALVAGALRSRSQPDDLAADSDEATGGDAPGTTDALAAQVPAPEAPVAEAAVPVAEVPAAPAPEVAAADMAPAAEVPGGPPEAELAESMQSVAALELPVPEAPAPQPPSTTSARPTPRAVPSRPGGPAPTLTPAAAAPSVPVAALPPLAEGAAGFGRVAEDGTVYVREDDAERSVGQFPDVAPDEALALFVRKYVDLAAQAHLLDQRLKASSVGAKEAAASLRSLREATVEPAVVGDLAALRTEIDRLDAVVAERAAAEEAERARARAAALEQREAIVREAEALADTDPQKMHFKSAGDRMQALLTQWKTAQKSGYRLDKKSEDVLWKRFSAARTTVDKLRRQHFSEVSEQRGSTKTAKEALIAEAEALQSSTDWRATGDAYRSLMDRWKAAGRLGRKEDDALWARFRAAQDVFFAARTAANQAQDEEYRASLEVKEKLLAEAEALLPVADAAAAEQAKKVLRGIQDRWDEAGRVPRADLERIEARLRKVLETVREAEAAKWGRGNPETVARGSGLIAQLTSQVADLDAKIAAAEARGDDKTAARARKDRQTKRTWLDQAQASLSELSR